ncbi:gliding motility lipoprotein GldD [Ancylomarina salipaludis]|uniref:Gliding motility lipoprotein GldD n=1 Tax=Ancylomarina salipaludis TaxID=2501299 RepID=A0A4Q1JQG1_9BACT|nr:gliding motility lipoprotein GldD [Ancylomarina salipaludis]RXQ96706.1 gliding motility lipoprotein GldD [Ancylomarina salipaludis]
MLRHSRILILSFFVVFACLPMSCREKAMPKPRGYFRIDLPVKKYEIWNQNYPFNFEYLKGAKVEEDKSRLAEKYWLNVEYPKYNAILHLSYKEVNENLEKYLEDSHLLVYKHAIKADAIDEKNYIDKQKNVFGLIYRIQGNAASPVQFIATDSVKHFLRGALYFNTHPNPDSLAPVIQYIDKDIVHLMESLKWK